MFDHNYEHDNQSQGFFIKDGDASDVTVADNLFLRNDNLGEGESNIQVFNTTNFVMTNNTVLGWSGRSDPCGRGCGGVDCVGQPQCRAVVQRPARKRPRRLADRGLRHLQRKAAVCDRGAQLCRRETGIRGSGADDYRLASNPNRIGVDWSLRRNTSTARPATSRKRPLRGHRPARPGRGTLNTTDGVDTRNRIVLPCRSVGTTLLYGRSTYAL